MGRILTSGSLSVWVEREAERWLVHVAGELEMSNVDLLDGELRRLEGGALPVVIDLSRLEFIDTTGLALLVKCLPGRIQVTGASGQVRDVLRTSGAGPAFA